MSIEWQTVAEYSDITFRAAEGIARLAINRPGDPNPFRPAPPP